MALAQRERYEIGIERSFTATHALRLPDGSMEETHGHDWPVVVTVASETLDGMGCVMDFHELEALVDAVLEPWRGAHLNAVAPFSEHDALNPSAERVAWWIGQQLRKRLRREAWLVKVSVGEAPGCTATYYAPRRVDRDD